MSVSTQPVFTFDSGTLPARDALDTWRDVIGVTHDVRLLDGRAPAFQASGRYWHLGKMMLSSGSFTAQAFTRTDTRARRDHLDHYGLFAQGNGQRLSQTDVDAVLHPGDLHVFDLAQVERSVASDGNSGTLFLPRELVDRVVPNVGSLHGRILRDGAARLLAHHILALGQWLESMPAEALPGLTRATMEMAIGCLEGAVTGTSAVETTPFELALRRKVERHIEAHLRDPGLSTEALATTFGISRSTLYRLFESSHGVAHFIKERRLYRIRSILVERQDPRPLAALAEDHGFASNGHFSREFRRLFGYSPSELRTGTQPVLPAGLATGSSPLDTAFRMLHP